LARTPQRQTHISHMVLMYPLPLSSNDPAWRAALATGGGMNCPTANNEAAVAPNFRKLRLESRDISIFGIITLPTYPNKMGSPGSVAYSPLSLRCNPARSIR
jgi:hypothetical protein